MKVTHAGILAYTMANGKIELFLVMPGGPYYEGMSEGEWGVPKGKIDADDTNIFNAAIREFHEETGVKLSRNGEFIELNPMRAWNGKILKCWAYHDVDKKIRFRGSNTFTLMWQGKMQEFEEVRDGRYFALAQAKTMMKHDQLVLVKQLVTELKLQLSDSPF